MWNNLLVARLRQKLERWHSSKALMLGLGLILTGSCTLAWHLLDHVNMFCHSTHLIACLEIVEQDVEAGNRWLVELSSTGNTQQGAALTEEAHLQLRVQTKEMEKHFARFQRAIEPVLEAKNVQGEIVWWTLQLRQKWAATHTYMNELASKSWQQAKQQKFLPPLSAQAQPTFRESAAEFSRAHRNYLQRAASDTYRRALWAFFVIVSGVFMIVILFWYRWWQPLNTLKQLGNTLQMEALPDFPESPVGTEWQEVWEMLDRMHRRLRTAEQFMRDLSMGRTPEPIPPEGEGDRIARSSYWLVRRWQQQQKELERRREAA